MDRLPILPRNLRGEEHKTSQREQVRTDLNFQQAGFERAAQEYEQAARDEVHVAGARKCLDEEMLETMGALENEAEHTWTSHQIMSLHEMNSVTGGALDNQRRKLLSEAIVSTTKSRTSSEYQQ